MCPREYRFVPVTRGDYPLLRHWLSQPHVAGWWGDPDTEIALIEEDIDSGPTDMRIVWHADGAFVYVQDYPAHHWPAPQFAGLPEDARAMDTFLGEPGYLGRGHASRYLRAQAIEIVARGSSTVVLDPDPSNARAIAAYSRAGFHGTDIRDCGDGTKARVMIFKG